MSKVDNELFTQHEKALENANKQCPECGEALTIKQGKSGTFIGCTAFPSCKFTRPIVEQNRMEEKVLVGSECPLCQHELAVKQGRYGVFIGCTNFPQCDHIEETHQQEQTNIACPVCKSQGKDGQLLERTNRFGKTFYACSHYPKCKFAVNHQPIEGECEKCGFGLLVKRKMSAGEKRQCAQKKCGHFQS